MKRLEVPSPGAPLILRSYDRLPETPAAGVLVKTSFCGICHSDIHFAEDEVDIGGSKKKHYSSELKIKFPLVLGHEISGVIHSIGKDAQRDGTDLKVGDRVIIFSWTGCDECGFCKTGDSNFCKKPQNFGIERNGGFSDYVPVARQEHVVKIPDSIPMDIACMLPCSGVTGYNAVSRIKPTIDHFIKHNGKATLLIIGAGGLGLWCLQTARAALPKGTRIISADVSQEKLDNALAHGADDTVLWDPSLKDADLIEMTKQKGTNGSVQAVIDFVNNSTTAPRGLASLEKGGAIALVGLFGGSMEVVLPMLVFGLNQVIGVFVGSLTQMKEFVQLVAKFKLKPPEISHVRLEEAPAILKKLSKGEITGRALIKF